MIPRRFQQGICFPPQEFRECGVMRVNRRIPAESRDSGKRIGMDEKVLSILIDIEPETSIRS